MITIYSYRLIVFYVAPLFFTCTLNTAVSYNIILKRSIVIITYIICIQSCACTCGIGRQAVITCCYTPTFSAKDNVYR